MTKPKKNKNCNLHNSKKLSLFQISTQFDFTILLFLFLLGIIGILWLTFSVNSQTIYLPTKEAIQEAESKKTKIDEESLKKVFQQLEEKNRRLSGL